MKLNSYKLYLFDFDGTLFNTLPSLYHVFIESFKALNIKIKNEDCLQLTRIPLIDGFLSKGGKKENFPIYVDKINEFLNTDKTVRLSETYPETIELINYIIKNNIHAGIVTSNNIPHVKEILHFFDIKDEAFKVYVGNQETKKSKPDPEPILKAIELYPTDIKKEEIIYIGDSYNDCKCAENAGVNSVLLDRENVFDEQYHKIHNLMELFYE